MGLLCEKYLQDNIDDTIIIKLWQDTIIFPIFLRNNYNFYELMIQNTKCILLEVIHEVPEINQLVKQIYQVNNSTDYHVILLIKQITQYRRKTLIQNKIAFVIEDGQMYLPFLSLDLKKVKDVHKENNKFFTTHAQIAFQYFLYNKDIVLNTTELAIALDFNLMSASRVLNELYHANLITYEIKGKTGRSKVYKRIPDPAYFQKGFEYLKTPIKKIVYTKSKPIGSLTAGLDALAELSMINPPDHPSVAIDIHKFNSIHNEVIQNKDIIKDQKLVEVQLWEYDPNLFSHNQHVNLASLYASLKNETDERVEQALEDVLRGESWYTD